jgi:hypothetical protein
MIERTTDFETFWKAYPRRVGKLAAQKAYRRSLVTATAQDILDGVARYIANKPDYADFCHPATWLHQGRWMDEYDEPAAKPSQSDDWFHECQELHDGTCGGSLKHRTRMIIARGVA